ncbi:MFS transporter [Salsuginibacillus kocurii]|uniref:MFS transporter n=1 Tax=Salsuginibacillus kocurii TaxID=427078 RepID=UPI000364773D|nr:MFS transporter [Salsuginibacillus kocurii]
MYKQYNKILNSSILNNKPFLKLWGGQSVSYMGDQIYLLALPLLVYEITGSGSQMAIVFGFEMIPFLLFSLIGGVLTDKWNKKITLILGNILAILPLMIIYMLSAQGVIEVWHIYIMSFILSSIVAMTLPAFEASIPSLVDKKDLIGANSLTELTLSLTRILGPAIGGGLIAWIGATQAILINAATYLIASLLISTIVIYQVTNISFNSKIKDSLYAFWEGLLYVPKHKILKWGVFLSTSSNIILGAYTSLLIYYMTNELNFTPDVIGIVFTVSSIASIIAAAILAMIIKSNEKSGLVMLVSLVCQGMGVLFVGLSFNLITLLIAQAIYVSSVTLYTINWRSLRQTVTPDNMLGRVSGVCRGIAFGGASLGGFLGGIFLSMITVSTLLMISGVIVISIALISIIKANDFKNINISEENKAQLEKQSV